MSESYLIVIVSVVVGFGVAAAFKLIGSRLPGVPVSYEDALFFKIITGVASWIVAVSLYLIGLRAANRLWSEQPQWYIGEVDTFDYVLIAVAPFFVGWVVTMLTYLIYKTFFSFRIH